MKMQDHTQQVDQLLQEISNGLHSRREVLRRGIALGLGAPLIAGLLAACGGDDDDDDSAAPTEDTGASSQPTATSAATEAAAANTETEVEPTEADAATSEPEQTEQTEEPSPTAAEADAGERGGAGKALLLYWQAPTILNPHLAQGTKDFAASHVCLEPLFTADPYDNPNLALAEEWPTIDNELLDPDGKFVIWKLRQGVKWHDGEDFNAEDVKFTYEFATNEDTTATTSGNFEAIESIDIIDDYTIQLNFSAPNPAWFVPFSSANGLIIPEHLYRDYIGAEARNAPYNLAPVGTGPFKVVDFKPGDVVLYEIFDDYWDPGKPKLDEVEIKGGGDATSAARAVLVTGEADWAWNLQVEPQVLEQMVSEGGNGELVSTPGFSAEQILINFADPNTQVDGAFAEPSTEHPIFKHWEARKAISYAIQRDVIAEQLYGIAGEPTAYNTLVPERFLPDLTWEYDLDKAKEQLDKIDFPASFDNTNILYQTSVNSVRQKTQEIVKSDLEKLGFTVELKSVDSAVFFSSDAGNPDTFGHFYADLEMYTDGPGSPYPINWTERYRSDQLSQKSNNWAGENVTRYFNPDFDKLHDQAKVTIDPDEQEVIWKQLNQIPYDDVVEIPVVHRGGAAAVHKRIKNWSAPAWEYTPVADLKNWET